MKAVALALGLLALGGCGSVYNLATGPQLYGGIAQDFRWANRDCSGNIFLFDLPLSAVLDTGLLPITALFEGIRWATAWPPKGVP